MASSEQGTPLGSLLGFIGLIAGLGIGANTFGSDNIVGVIICGVVLAAVGAFVGNLIFRLLVIAVSIVVAVISFNVRQEVTIAVLDEVKTNVQAQTAPKIYGTSRTNWEFCNHSNKPKVSIAISYLNNGNWISEGWWVVNRGKCKTLSPSTSNRYFYYYANSGNIEWGGDTSICLHEHKKFRIGDIDCSPPYSLRKFKKVDTKGKRGGGTNLTGG